jgi:DNA-binding CsgD family transcriptional regulator
VSASSKCMITEVQNPRGAPRGAVTRPPDPERVYRTVCDALLNSGHGLTPREAEVCASIVLGSRISGTSRRLNISTHTVATHRKRAYSKLGIGSQNELFARYFDTLCSLHLS